MQTTRLFFIALVAILSFHSQAQEKGNYDYRKAIHSSTGVRLSSAQQLAHHSPVGFNTFSIKGLYNIEADSYLAIFTVTQVGKNQHEADSLVQAKIEAIKNGLQAEVPATDLFVDMISFIPIFEVEVSKKLFSKDTYNEIPKGFELKQNLHFRYKEPGVLNKLVSLCAKQEIYDLVRVDYFIDDLEAKKAELMAKAETLLSGQLSRYQKLLGANFSEGQKQLSEAFATHYPIEQYQSYTAYCSNKLNLVKQNDTFVQDTKTTSEFYMPKSAKGYDFVINASILEPVVQIEYELLFSVSPEPEEAKEPKAKPTTEIQKQIILVTPDGQIRKLPL